MDLLGSILGSMDAVPPCKPVDAATKKKIKEAKMKAMKFKDDERRKRSMFRENIEKQINEFLQSPAENRKYQFKAMSQIDRSIAHDVAEVAGLTSYSFGEEEVDRRLVVWKKEYAPSEAELEAMRNGEEYDPEAASRLAEQVREQKEKEEEDQKNSQINAKKRRSNTEPEKYFEKYAKILGEESGLNAAKATKSNKSYGMVPSKIKEDKRSIEETMNAIRKRKKEVSAETT